MDEQPMSYLLFKFNMEMNYQNTFEKDDLVRKEYNKYLQGIERSKKKEGRNPLFNKIKVDYLVTIKRVKISDNANRKII